LQARKFFSQNVNHSLSKANSTYDCLELALGSSSAGVAEVNTQGLGALAAGLEAWVGVDHFPWLVVCLVEEEGVHWEAKVWELH